MNAVATLQDTRTLVTERDMMQPRVIGAPASMFNDPQKFEHAQRVARVFAESQLVPNHMRGKLPDCMIALNLADRLNEDPLTVMQNIVVVHGSPGWKATYLIARANVSGRLHGPIRWKHEGTPGKAGYVCSAYADLADPRLSPDERRIESAVSWEMAEAEGWTKNAKYKSMPQVMMQYRSATFLVRLYLSDIMLGIQSTDVELETSPDENGVYQVTGSGPSAPPTRTQRQQLETAAAGPDDVVDQTTGEVTSAIRKPPARTRGQTIEHAEADRIVDADGQVLKDRSAETSSTSGEQTSTDADFPGDTPLTKEPNFEALLAAFIADAPNATTEDELGTLAADLRQALDDYPQGRDFQIRAENAWTEHFDRIKKPGPRLSPEEMAKNQDYKRGYSDAEKGLNKCIVTAIKDDPARYSMWQSGHNAYRVNSGEA